MRCWRSRNVAAPSANDRILAEGCNAAVASANCARCSEAFGAGGTANVARDRSSVSRSRASTTRVAEASAETSSAVSGKLTWRKAREACGRRHRHRRTESAFTEVYVVGRSLLALDLHEKVAQHLNLLDLAELGPDPQLVLLEQFTERATVNEVNRWSAVAGCLLLGVGGEGPGRDE